MKLFVTSSLFAVAAAYADDDGIYDWGTETFCPEDGKLGHSVSGKVWKLERHDGNNRHGDVCRGNKGHWMTPTGCQRKTRAFPCKSHTCMAGQIHEACRAPGTEWVLLANHEIKKGEAQVFPKNDQVESGSFGTEGDALFLNLNQQYSDKKFTADDGLMTFQIRYPKRQGTQTLTWRQSNSPLSKKVTGFAIQHNQINAFKQGSQSFNGMCRSSHANSLLDGQGDHGNWFYSVGTQALWHGSIPGPRGTGSNVNHHTSGVKQVQLWIKVRDVVAINRARAFAINENDFSSIKAMEKVGWTASKNMHHHHRGYGKQTTSGAVCDTGDNYWGFAGGNPIGTLTLTAPIDSFAEIDVGNCFSRGKVIVTVNGKEIIVAKTGEGSKKSLFTVKEGDTITITEHHVSIMRLNSLKFYAVMEQPTQYAVQSVEEECKAINKNDFSNVLNMMKVGWVPGQGTGNHKHMAKVFRQGRGGAVCDNHKGNYWAWAGGRAVGTMSLVSPVSTDVTIDFGNCWNQGFVGVYRTRNGDEEEMATAQVGQGEEKVTFAVLKGDTIIIKDVGVAIIRINSVAFASCESDKCEAEHCSTWDCAHWCECFDNDMSGSGGVYESNNCFDNDEDTCQC